mgnify:CR=1 FL=1
MDLTKEELSVQTDRIIEQYKLDLNNGPELLAELTSWTLAKEKQLADEIKHIAVFYNPKGMKWIGERDDLGDNVYTYYRLESICGTFFYAYVEIGYFTRNIKAGIYTLFSDHEIVFDINIDKNEGVTPFKKYSSILDPIIKLAKEKVIDTLKERGFNITDVG